jgi:hypothetical protein
MYCQRHQFTKIMTQKGISADFLSGNLEDFPHFDQEYKDALSKMILSVLAEIDKIWPMFPSTDEIEDVGQQKCATDADKHCSSQRCASPPPVNNAFQFYGLHPGRSSQHENDRSAAAGEQTQPTKANDAACTFWIRPWDSVFDRKKNGFGTFFAKQVLGLCHCDETTISRILDISMRHIAVKKSEMVHSIPLAARMLSRSIIALDHLTCC